MSKLIWTHVILVFLIEVIDCLLALPLFLVKNLWNLFIWMFGDQLQSPQSIIIGFMSFFLIIIQGIHDSIPFKKKN